MLARLRVQTSNGPMFLGVQLLYRTIIVSDEVATSVAEAAKYRGVCFNKQRRVFDARLTVKGRKYFAGSFRAATEAAKMYDQRLRDLCGSDKQRLQRCLNFPSEEEAAYQETARHARRRGMDMNGGKYGTHRKELQAFELLNQAFARSPVSQHYEIRRLSGASKADALFVQRSSPEVGLPLQLKASSGHGPQARTYSFQSMRGYDGMLVLCVALKDGHMWAVAGQNIVVNTLHITLGCNSDRQLRVDSQDIGPHLAACLHDARSYPHMSMVHASMQCASRSHMVEAATHLQLQRLFSCIRMRLTRPSLHNSAVDSWLEINHVDAQGVHLRLQEKASNKRQRRYVIRLSKCGGALGRQAYARDDFDVLVACVLAENKLDGMFFIPAALLVDHGFIGLRPTHMLLYPPWHAPVKKDIRSKYAWQPEFFLDLRKWNGSDELPQDLGDRLETLVARAATSAVVGA